MNFKNIKKKQDDMPVKTNPSIEMWRTVKEFEDYEVSNFGNIRRIDNKKVVIKYVDGVAIVQKMLYFDKGYRDYKTKNMWLRLLIMRTFNIKNPYGASDEVTIETKNGNPKDNSLYNLKWALVKKATQLKHESTGKILE